MWVRGILITKGVIDNVTLVDTTTTNTDLVSAASIRSEIDSNSTQLSGIKTVTDVIPNSGALTDIHDNIAYGVTVLTGALSNAGAATETYTFTLGSTAYTATYADLDVSGNRGTTVLSKV